MRRDANRCFVCGPTNPIGLKLHFTLDADGVCRTTFTPGPDHGGYDQLTHGGIVYSALDDVMANRMFLAGIRAHTARCEIRYRKPLPLGTAVRLEGRLTGQRGNVAFLEGQMYRVDDGTLVADATGTFMVVASAG